MINKVNFLSGLLVISTVMANPSSGESSPTAAKVPESAPVSEGGQMASHAKPDVWDDLSSG